MKSPVSLLILILCCLAVRAAGGETIPLAEMQALDRAINREASSGQLGTSILGDLRRLRQRLQRMQSAAQSAPPSPDKVAALQLLGESGDGGQLERLEAEAAAGGRAARRSLALYHLFRNEPEKALAQWRSMGKANDSDLPYLILSAYMEMALGEYNAGRNNLETALRYMDTRSTLLLSTPLFCSNIGGYRIYTPRTGGDLLPGEEVLIYVEVDGAEFTAAPDGGSECRIMFGLRLRNESQATVWAESNYGEYAPVFAGRIRDLHAALTWRVPNDLQPGRYHLLVEAVEDKTKRRGESLISFNVARRPTNPETRPTYGASSPGDIDRRLNDASRPFTGGPNAPAKNESAWDSDFARKQMFDIVKEHERAQRVDR